MGGGALGLPKFLAPLQTSLAVSKGLGTYTFTNTSADDTRSVTDFEGIIHTDILAEEARFQGVRRVRNFVDHEYTVDNWTLAGTGAVTLGAVGADAPRGYEICDISGGATNTCSLTCSALEGEDVAGRTFVVRVRLAVPAVDTTKSVRINITSTGGTVFNEELTITGVEAWHTYAFKATPPAGATGLTVMVKTGLGGGADTAYIQEIQLEEVTGQTVGEQGIPSEYVSVGFGTSMLVN
ncbi:unnamed protein product, partial [marine sediment metagenome]